MSIAQIVYLAEIIHRIQGGSEWKVATQSWPDYWFRPTNNLQWYIDANWLIWAGGLTYDPNAKDPLDTRP